MVGPAGQSAHGRMKTGAARVPLADVHGGALCIQVEWTGLIDFVGTRVTKCSFFSGHGSQGVYARASSHHGGEPWVRVVWKLALPCAAQGATMTTVRAQRVHDEGGGVLSTKSVHVLSCTGDASRSRAIRCAFWRNTRGRVALCRSLRGVCAS